MVDSVIIEASHLSKKVKSGDSEIHILRDINLTVSQGETIAILGTSGSGKTTLLSILAGLDRPSGGTVHLQSQDITSLAEDECAMLRRKYIGFIFQSFNLLPSLTALENVMLPLDIQYASYHHAKSQALLWLERLNLLPRIHHYPHQLSGGEQQRVAIARACVTQPSVLFADEMTGNLDEETGQLVSAALFDLNQKFRMTLILVTHDQYLASQCQRQLRLTHGVLHLL